MAPVSEVIFQFREVIFWFIEVMNVPHVTPHEMNTLIIRNADVSTKLL